MPGLLSRRRRGSSAQPNLSRSTLAGAASAATQAYINQSSQNASFSASAAAAAALRSHATTPEPVGNLVTKRMVRRGSTSSNGSAHPTSGTPARAGLQRTNSMTERTFRSVSPSPSRGNGTAPSNVSHPPMPPMPKTMRNGPPKRPGSTEPPARVFSPTPPRAARSASMDITNTSGRSGYKQVNRLSNVPEAAVKGNMQGNRSSVNFSRPRMTSPDPSEITQSPGNKYVHTAGGWYAGPVGSASASGSKPGNEDMEETMVFDANSRTFVKQLRPKPKAEPKAEPPSPVVDSFPALKPGDFDPATRRIVPSPAPSRTVSAEKVPSLPTSPAAKKTADPIQSLQSPTREASTQIEKTASPRSVGLHKQPSVVREDPDAERAAEQGVSQPTHQPVTSSKPATNVSKIEPAAKVQHKRVVSLDVPRGPGDGGRGGSISPSRSARFSASPVVQSVMHEPLLRGTSPAKSALKHSPSSSIRAASPITTFSPTASATQGAASDMSDTTSLTSADGSTSGNKKRRSVRVSWDDAGAVPPLPDTAKATIANSKSTRAQDLVSDDDAEDYSTPRPVLPVFGRVRQDKASEGPIENGISSSEAKEVRAQPVVQPQPVHEPVPQPAHEPVPPEVTSKEAPEPDAGNEASDEEAPDSIATAPPTVTTVVVEKPVIHEPPQPLPTEAQSLPTQPVIPQPAIVQPSAIQPDVVQPTQIKPEVNHEPEVLRQEQVPAINLHPPTPALHNIARQPSTDDDLAGMSESQELRNLALGIVRYGDESDSSASKSVPAASKTVPAAPKYVRKDSDGDVYSDAPESQEGGGPQGFASLDAIVESPVASPVRATAPDTALTALPPSASEKDADPNVDWSAASAHWSQHKAQAVQAQLSSGDEKKSKRSFFKRHKQKKESQKEVEAVQSQQLAPIDVPAPLELLTTTAPPEEPVSPVSTPTKSVPNSSAQPRKSALRNSTAIESQADGVHLPKTMRGPSASVRGQGQQNKVTGARPISLDYGAPRQTEASRSQRLSHSGPYPSQTPSASKPTKKVKDDSDSDTSFKRKRTSSVDAQGRYSMRKSMRDNSQRISSPPPNAGRSMSPMSDSGREGKATSLRQSLRSGQQPARTMRGPKDQAASNAPKVAPVLASRFKSRYADSDSSDEDKASQPRQAYRSRFIDSDEDDTIAEKLTPVRGIPKRNGQQDGDSTDLDEESEARGSPSKRKSAARQTITTDPAEVEKAMDLARKKLGLEDKSASGQGQALTQASLRNNGRDRDEDKVLIPADLMSDAGSEATNGRRKKGFMRGLLGRSRASSQSIHRGEDPPPPLPIVPSPRVPDGPAKLVRRSSQPPRLERGNSTLSSTTAPATSTTAPVTSITAPTSSSQKPADKESEHWPLPPPIPDDKFEKSAGRDVSRPQTSDDGMHSGRLERPSTNRSFSARVGFTDEAIAHSEKDESERGEEGSAVYSQRTGRKKKFGMLRRAFGLYD